MKLSCLNVFGGESFSIASVFRIKDVVPSLFIVYPSHSTCLQANYYLSNDMTIFSPSNPQELFVGFVCVYRSTSWSKSIRRLKMRRCLNNL